MTISNGCVHVEGDKIRAGEAWAVIHHTREVDSVESFIVIICFCHCYTTGFVLFLLLLPLHNRFPSRNLSEFLSQVKVDQCLLIAARNLFIFNFAFWNCRMTLKGLSNHFYFQRNQSHHNPDYWKWFNKDIVQNARQLVEVFR